MRRIFEATQQRATDHIDFVVRHTDTGLPVIGRTAPANLRLTTRNGRATIETQPTVFADEYITALADSRHNYLSVELRSSDWSIERIAFVHNPAVVGLPPVQFSADAIVFEELEPFSTTTTHTTMPAPTPPAAEPQRDQRETFSRADFEELARKQQAEFDARLAATLKSQEERTAQLERQNRTLVFESALSSAELAGRVTPALKPIILRLMEALADRSFQFSDATGKQFTVAANDDLLSLLKLLPKQYSNTPIAVNGISFGAAGTDGQAAKPLGVIMAEQFNATNGYTTK